MAVFNRPEITSKLVTEVTPLMLLAMVCARSLAARLGAGPIEGDGTVLGVHVDLDGTQVRVFGQARQTPGR